MIPTIDLGHGLQVSQIGFGAMSLGGAYGRADDHESIDTLNRAIDLGVTFIDTANVYGRPRDGVTGPAGTNEELIAEVLKTRRDKVQIATKFAITGIRDGSAPAVRGDHDYVIQCCDESLRRLGVDTIDLYYMHRPELGRPIEETVGAMAELVKAGKVRHLGLSEVTGPELRAAAAIHPITAVQTEYSLWSRDVEANVIPTAAELGTGFVPYSPLGRGFLTGQLSREMASKGVLQGQERIDQNFDANQRVVDAVRAIADEVGATPAQVALAWLIAQGQAFGLPVVSIPGTCRAARVEENAGAVDVALTTDQKQRLDQVADLAIGGRSLAFNGPGWISADRE